MPEVSGHLMGKIGFQKYTYQGYIPPSQSQHMKRFLLRLQSLASSNPADPPDPADLPLMAEGMSHRDHTPQQPKLLEPPAMVTVAVLDLKLQTLLQDLTHNITRAWKNCTGA